MQSVFPHLKSPNILVIGDLMIDHTIIGSVTRIANEGPIPVLNESNETWTLGGCGNVAVNCKALEASVYLCSAIGEDSTGLIAKRLLKEHRIEWVGLTLNAYKTTIKHRGFADSKLVFRYDQEETLRHNMFSTINNILSFFESTHIDAVIFSDYNKGFCDISLIKSVLYQCKTRGIPTIVDPKGDFRNYSGCSILKPNRDEARKFIQNYLGKEISELNELHKVLLDSIGCDYTCITMAKEGLTICESKTKEIVTAQTQSIEVIDVTGAGDVVNCVLGYCMACGVPIGESAKIAAFLATQSVQHKGTYILRDVDFMALNMYLRRSKIIGVGDLCSIPRNKKTVVFTNGCFDLVHAGHIQSLKFAKEQGDILIVGVNSDASIKRLKGNMRPILSLDERLAVLEALECVDYICSFEEDSPLELVKILRPDVLVKGEDYRGKEVKSAEFAGRVVLAPLKPAISTTELIKRVQVITRSPPS